MKNPNGANVELIYRQIGVRVEQLRTTLGWTQEELAKKLGYGRVSITNIEIGRQRIPLHQLLEICKVFGTTPKHFLRGIWT